MSTPGTDRILASSVRRTSLTAVGAGLAALVALAVVPEALHACAVCFDPRSENRFAFVATTAFLSLLPLGMVAGAGVWLRRRIHELDGLESDGAEGPDPDGRAD
ncbi:MAG: hypothetical protein RJQ04_05985 [Longimicrobiales bacterium]